MPTFHCLGFVLLGLSAASVVPARADALDDTIVALMQKRHVPGLSLAVVHDGKIVRARGYGVIENGGTTPVTADTLFQAGSVSKPVAAFGVLRLVDGGKLTVDADVNTALKSWHVPENEFTKTEKVTLRRILSHRAGLTVHGFPGYAVGATRPTLIQVLDGAPPANTPAIRVDVEPGSIARYSGGGYTVMQQLVVDVTGKPYPDFMRDTVLQPLGMLASSYEQPLSETRAAKTATGHLPGGKVVPGRWHVYPEMAAAGLWTTASDLARFVIGMQHALAEKSDTLLKPATARLMVTPEKGGNGLGFAVSDSGHAQRFSHNGRDEGFDAQLVGFCEGGRGAVILINVNENSNFMNHVMAAVVKEYGWTNFAPVAPPASPIEDTEPEVTAQVKGIFEQAQAGKFDRELFTEKLADFLAQQIPDGDVMRDLRAMGALKSITLIGKRVNGASRSYRYRIVFENDVAIETCNYNDEGKISGINLQPE
jgi:CubicO group peptidase (beta-lactamase class C family)